jgi:integral membrane sensor domain MASE1
VYVVSAWRVWWQADAFGGRMLISTTPILVVGAAQLIERTRHMGEKWLVLAGAAILSWNLAFFIQYRFGFIPMGDPITWRQLVLEKFTLPLQILRRVRS